jgi:hypothetical protein
MLLTLQHSLTEQPVPTNSALVKFHRLKPKTVAHGRNQLFSKQLRNPSTTPSYLRLALNLWLDRTARVDLWEHVDSWDRAQAHQREWLDPLVVRLSLLNRQDRLDLWALVDGLIQQDPEARADQQQQRGPSGRMNPSDRVGRWKLLVPWDLLKRAGQLDLLDLGHPWDRMNRADLGVPEN